ncbi:MAG: tyrosine-type recombinase/integrase [Pseudomonadota bacterium]
MAIVRLKGLNRVRTKDREGRPVVYWYAWKGGPRLPGQPGSPEFLEAYQAAHAGRKAAHFAAGPQDTLAGLVARYRAAPEFTRLSDATRAEWARWLDRIAQAAGERDIGDLPLALLDDRRVRADLLDWRDQWADRPRSADYAIQVLSRVLAFGVDRGLLAVNAAAGVAQLYEGGRADRIWTAGEIARFCAAAPSPEVAFIVRLACLTGLRRADLTRLAWSHVGELAIVLPTGKSRGRRTATVPLLPETHELLAEIRDQQAARLAELTAQAKKKRRPPPPAPTTVLTNTRGRPWTPDGLEAQVIDTKSATKKNGRPGAAIEDRSLHDARGTFVTRLRHAGLTAPEIADTVGWTEERVERLLKTYVDQDAIVLSIAARLGARGKPDE